MAAIDDDAEFFARFSAEASNSAVEAIDDALAATAVSQQRLGDAEGSDPHDFA
jgi:hypothetical protein